MFGWLLTTKTFVKVMFPVLLTTPLNEATPPTGDGQVCVIAMAGVVTNGQVADALSLTTVAVDVSVPLAVAVLLTEQALAGVVKLAVKLAEAPGARLGTVNTTVLGAGSLLTTTTSVNVTLPVLLTVPV
jgi:hypothetical protein